MHHTAEGEMGGSWCVLHPEVNRDELLTQLRTSEPESVTHPSEAVG